MASSRLIAVSGVILLPIN